MHLGERMKHFFARVREFFAKLSRRTKILLGLLLAATVAVIAVVLIRGSNRNYTVLFTDLSSDDMSAVLSYLETNSVTDYRVENNNRILVPDAMADRLKMEIMLQGYPTSGFGYQLYLTNVGSLTSDTDRTIFERYDLQERLGAAISYIPGVREARVFITPGEDRRFILSTDDVIEAQAAVIVDMVGNRMLTDQQVTAIRNLVSHAVQGLEIEEVTITDSAGNAYIASDGINTADAGSLKLALEAQYNAAIRANILRLLESMFGAGNVTVSVNSTVDVTHTFKDSTIYELPEYATDGSTEGRGIVDSRQWGNGLVREDGAGVGGVPGTTTNADLNEYVVNQSQLDGNEREITTSGRVDYDVTQHRVQNEDGGGTVVDLMVAVAINSTMVDVPNTEYLVQLIARSAGISAEVETEKVAIMSYPFWVSPPEPPEAEPEPLLPPWAIYALIGGGILFLLLLILILLLRRRSRRKKAQKAQEAIRAQVAAIAAGEPSAEIVILPSGDVQLADGTVLAADTPEAAQARAAIQQAQAQAEAAGIVPAVEGEAPESGEDEAAPEETPEGVNIMDLDTERGMALRKDVRSFVEENPAIAAQMLKNWLKGGEGDAQG